MKKILALLIVTIVPLRLIVAQNTKIERERWKSSAAHLRGASIHISSGFTVEPKAKLGGNSQVVFIGGKPIYRALTKSELENGAYCVLEANGVLDGAHVVNPEVYPNPRWKDSAVSYASGYPYYSQTYNRRESQDSDESAMGKRPDLQISDSEDPISSRTRDGKVKISFEIDNDPVFSSLTCQKADDDDFTPEEIEAIFGQKMKIYLAELPSARGKRAPFKTPHTM